MASLEFTLDVHGKVGAGNVKVKHSRVGGKGALALKLDHITIYDERSLGLKGLVFLFEIELQRPAVGPIEAHVASFEGAARFYGEVRGQASAQQHHREKDCASSLDSTNHHFPHFLVT